MISLLRFFLTLLVSPLKSKSRKETLNARGISMPHGSQWYAKSVSNLLARA